MQHPPNSSRRQFLGLAGGAAVLGALPVVTVRPAEATPTMLASAIQTVTGGAAVRTGKVKLDIPPLVENGNTVPMTVTVNHPMAPSGAPARLAASAMISATRVIQRAADGCGLTTMAQRALMAMRIL